MSYDSSRNRVNDSFYGATDNVRNTVLNNTQWTYYTDRNGLGDITQKSNQNEAHLFEYRGDKKLKKFTLLKNGAETVVNYYFDALGRRVAKDMKTPTEAFTQTYSYEADQDKILLGKSGAGPETLYIDGQGIDEHLAQISSTEVRAYTVNHLGTVLNSEASDQVKEIGAFGEQLQSVSGISSTSNPVIYGFTGRQLDDEGSTYYYRERQYDPELGRFLSKDPIGFAGGDTNLYRYVFNRSTMLTDPTGLAVGDWWDLPANFDRAEEIGREELARRANAHNNIGDAMRHAEWMRRTTQETNLFTAWAAGTGHEVEGLWRGQPISEAMMDLHNNAVGRNAGSNSMSVDPSNLWTLPLNDSQYNPYRGICGK